jgi:DNA topoisomerase-2
MENENTEDVHSDEGSEVSGDYGYLLGMTLWALTKERKDELLKKRDDKLAELKILQGRSPSSLWKEDLDTFLKEVSFDKTQHFFKMYFLAIFI